MSVRLSARTVEVFDGPKQVATHERAFGRYVEVLLLDHYPRPGRGPPGAPHPSRNGVGRRDGPRRSFGLLGPPGRADRRRQRAPLFLALQSIIREVGAPRRPNARHNWRTDDRSQPEERTNLRARAT